MFIVIDHSALLEPQYSLTAVLLNRNNVRLKRFTTEPQTMKFWIEQDFHNPKTVLRHTKKLLAADPKFGQAFADEVQRIVLMFEPAKPSVAQDTINT